MKSEDEQSCSPRIEEYEYIKIFLIVIRELSIYLKESEMQDMRTSLQMFVQIHEKLVYYHFLMRGVRRNFSKIHL
jgi:hypothetical protein